MGWAGDPAVNLQAGLTRAVKVRVSGIFGRERTSDYQWAMAKPQPTPWRDTPVLPRDRLPPPFSHHLEYRLTGPAPFSGGPEPVAAGWIRLREPGEHMGPAELVALADAYWPAPFAIETSFRAMATVSYSLQLTARAYGLPVDEPLFYRSRALAADAGFAFELRELWTASGELVAINPQTFAVIT